MQQFTPAGALSADEAIARAMRGQPSVVPSYAPEVVHEVERTKPANRVSIEFAEVEAVDHPSRPVNLADLCDQAWGLRRHCAGVEHASMLADGSLREHLEGLHRQAARIGASHRAAREAAQAALDAESAALGEQIDVALAALAPFCLGGVLSPVTLEGQASRARDALKETKRLAALRKVTLADYEREPSASVTVALRALEAEKQSRDVENEQRAGKLAALKEQLADLGIEV